MLLIQVTTTCNNVDVARGGGLHASCIFGVSVNEILVAS